jgi:hypothetical protein
MTLQEYVAAHCPDGPAQLRRLILERTGTDIPYAYVWKWCDPKRPCAVSVENAQILHAATQGKCTLHELQSLKVIRSRKVAPRRKPAAKAKAKALKTVKRRPKKLSKAAKLRNRIKELERQLAEATDAMHASQVA